MGKGKISFVGENVEPVFLVENDLAPLERPLRPGYYRIGRPRGEVELLESLPLDVLRANVENYLVSANAVPYLANVIRPDPKEEWYPGKKIEGTPRKEIIFSGGIVIFKIGKIATTEVEGLERISFGEIWLGREASKFQLSANGLYRIVFGDATTEEQKISRVESIVKGYEVMEGDEEERIERERRGSFDAGQSHAEGRARRLF
ncbi:hypothetical protein J4407_03170 [Candidatus Pacearchaeota archaeon]|nr:hypothetical protein [Candidatus Pacearchaeota archaeon]